MKLINVSNFLKQFSDQIPGDKIDAIELRLALLNEPTVDAIPVEWIKGYITPFQEFHDCLSEELKENDGAGWVVDVLVTMLREWEKENGL